LISEERRESYSKQSGKIGGPKLNSAQRCQTFLDTKMVKYTKMAIKIPKDNKIYQNGNKKKKYTTMATKIPNNIEIYQNGIKNTK
jgi:hypothetical protein